MAFTSTGNQWDPARSPAGQAMLSNGEMALLEENHYETLRCLKWGKIYGIISEEAYQNQKVEVLSRM